MIKKLTQTFTGACIALLLPLAVTAQTTFFSDNFTGGSTVNAATPVTPTLHSASYEFVGSLAEYPPASVSANDLRYGITNGGGGNLCEIQALFTGNPVALSQPGDYVQLTIVYTNTTGIWAGGSGTCEVGIGLYNSGGVYPLGNANGFITEGMGNASGGVQDWAGYETDVSDTTSSLHYEIFGRPSNASNPGSDNQDLVTQGSSTKSFSNNGGLVIGTPNSTSLVQATTNIVYTNVLTITLIAPSQVAITNNLYTVAGLATTIGGTNSAAAYTTAAFDGLAMGFYKKGDISTSNVVDIASITVVGSVTAITGPPNITQQPAPVVIGNNGAGAFSVTAVGANVTYQWHRHGTNLIDGGNISGSTSSQLAITSASSADVASSGADGYYVTVTGTGPYSTNSVTNSLSLETPNNLFYSGSGAWDLKTSESWNTDDLGDSANFFNFGDAVTFDDGGGGGTVTLTGSYLSASSVTVSHTSSFYTWTGSGSFAGPGKLTYNGSGLFTINNANTFSGGTIISNAAANLKLGNGNGLGTGPVTLAEAGGKMEWTVAGSATSGLGDVVVADSFTMIFDAGSTYAGVFNGNLSGTSGKTLTLQSTAANTTTNERIRVFGTNTVCNANITFSSGGSDLMSLAPYNTMGTQTYNGTISGDGSIWVRGNGLAVLNGNNNYSGGTYTTAGGLGLGLNSTPTSGTVTSGPIGTGPLEISSEAGSASGSGMVYASGGAITIANALAYPTNNQILIVGGTNPLTFAGSCQLYGVDGIITNRTWQVTNTAATTITGIIGDAGHGCGFIKTGGGNLYLDANNTYTGPTTNNSAITNAGFGVLAGTGSLTGSLFVQSGSAIGGGDFSGIGTFTVGGNLALSGGGWFRVNRSGSQSDQVFVTGTAANIGTGTVTITNLGATLQIGDTFTLFNKAVTGGAALTITNIGGGFVWSNGLAVNGKVSVLSLASSITTITVSPAITNIVFSGSNLTLNGTNGQSGATAYLLMTTNLISPLNQWKTVATNVLGGNAYSFIGTNVVTPVLGRQFYRLSSTNYNP
ncbi:MAG TPA: hypothetical protein VK742_20870 [Candidatus Sulfotelmatobacter sp.]|jgi:fibronectin-binding autotransporter adhesin|nr:hypothetical protein [Candidatus Sulfotelmatobacter sp.]